MKLKNLLKIAVLTACCALTLSVKALNSHNQRHNICDPLKGQNELYGICYAYCVTLDCADTDIVNREQQAQIACYQKLNLWNQHVGELGDKIPLPCQLKSASDRVETSMNANASNSVDMSSRGLAMNQSISANEAKIGYRENNNRDNRQYWADGSNTTTAWTGALTDTKQSAYVDNNAVAFNMASATIRCPDQEYLQENSSLTNKIVMH